MNTLDAADSYRIRQARPEEAEAVHALMVDVADGMEDPSAFFCDDLASVREYLNNPAAGFGVVAVDEDDAIVGSFIVAYPGMSEENLGRDIGLPEEALPGVAHMETAVVRPSARGHHLQGRMLAHAESLIDTSVHSCLLATVAPTNAPSLKTVESAGFRVVMRKLKYGGLDRLILRKDVGAGREPNDA